MVIYMCTHMQACVNFITKLNYYLTFNTDHPFPYEPTSELRMGRFCTQFQEPTFTFIITQDT